MDDDSQARALQVPASRMARLGRMGAMTAGVAGNMAVNGLLRLGQGQRPSARELLLTPANIRRIADDLAKMRGAAMKLGQLVSMDTGDVLPPELTDILARLRADADFMPPKQLRVVLDQVWGPDWRKAFRHFDVRPIAAASIGQVHRAVLRDGTVLAVKVQYPGIVKSIDSDVANVGRLIRMSGLLPKGFELEPYLAEATRQLHDEADYALEARHLQRFNALLKDDPDFVLPAFHAPLSSDRVLAMSFLEGHPIEQAQDASQTIRDSIATRLARLMLRELFEFGLMQTDPNFANYLYHPASDRIVLLDFGATRAVDAHRAEGLRAFVQAGMARDAQAVSRLADELGFLPMSIEPHFRERILEMIAFVFETLLADPLLDLATNDLSRRLSQMGEALARDGFVPPPVPMDLLFIQRKVAGIFLLAARLKARIPVADLLAPYLHASCRSEGSAPVNRRQSA